MDKFLNIDLDNVQISLQAIFGEVHASQTLRFLGRIKTVEVSTLVDSGSTYNFINWPITNKRGLPIKPLNVFLGGYRKWENRALWWILLAGKSTNC